MLKERRKKAIWYCLSWQNDSRVSNPNPKQGDRKARDWVVAGRQAELTDKLWVESWKHGGQSKSDGLN